MKAKQTILVIDDDPSILLGLKAKIERHGYRVITAKDGRQGIEEVKKNAPDLVLSDVMMPFLDGFEMRKIIREDAKFATIPFIFLTARTEKEDRLRGFEEGADDYIVKPFETEELLARIDAILQRVHFEQTRGREEMKKQAEEELNKLKQEILQNFHHELRTPLTNILMPLELAVNNKVINPEDKIQFIRMALSNANRLESLSTDLILLSNIDQGNLNDIRQPLAVKTHLINLLEKRLERYKEKDLDFNAKLLTEDEIFVPRREFSHVILHLVDNAFKFSPNKGKVNLIIKSLENGIGISVEDNGIGVPADLREKVFDRFYQISQGDTREHEGLGVGLNIARAFFEMNKGYVKIIDSKHGCHVVAMLPN